MSIYFPFDTFPLGKKPLNVSKSLPAFSACSSVICLNEVACFIRASIARTKPSLRCEWSVLRVGTVDSGVLSSKDAHLGIRNATAYRFGPKRRMVGPVDMKRQSRLGRRSKAVEDTQCLFYNL